jgi:hypothetical protein
MTQTKTHGSIHQILIASPVGLLALLVVTSCSSPRSDEGTNTNWSNCSSDTECGSSQRCVARHCVSAEIFSAEAGNAVTPNALQTDAGAPIEVDCRPRYDIVGNFASRCQYLGATRPELSCTDLGSPIGAPSVGSFRLTVEHPERIADGRPVVLDAADPDVTFAVGFAPRTT